MSTVAVAAEEVRSARRAFGRVATIITIVTIPIVTYYLTRKGHGLAESVAVASLAGIVARGMIDLFYRKIVPIPSLHGVEDDDLRAEDALQRRRISFWRHKLKLLPLWIILWWQWDAIYGLLSNPGVLLQALILPLFFIMNFAILFGPLMLMGIMQMKTLEPGDADFGVKLGDVRGQKEAKEEIRKVVTLWESGEAFAKAGGKRERGVLFMGAPGTGKTMLAKAIATGFNSPILLMPGSAFAQTFIGMDVVIVQWMARKARKLAHKWAGSCIIFIDEIDAVGMRRSTLGGMPPMIQPQMPGGMFGGMGGMAINQLLVTMDGIDSPPWLRRTLTNKVNLWLDAFFIVPRRSGNKELRLPRAKPSGNQIYFVGATNVPLEALDPALTRPGRMGRHVYFRVPTKRDRIDVFDLYLGKVDHESTLDTDKAREELARITQGYSPAQIEQVCSLALSYAHHSGREAFSREDILEAMVTVEAGMALGWGYESDEEEKSTAIHEAGHAITSYLYEDDTEAVRLSIRMRGNTGGHLQSTDVVERFAKSRAELFSRLVCIVGAYAAEFAYYGHNTQGVGGDMQQASHLVGNMTGRWGMAPMPIEGDEKKLLAIGGTLLAAALPGDVALSPGKMRAEALLLGQAFVTAYNAVEHNRMAIDKIVETLVQRKEIYGDDLTALLAGCGLEKPVIEWDKLETYPEIGTIPSEPKFMEGGKA